MPPIRQQSIRIQDISPPKIMFEAACLEKLTHYEVYSIHKIPNHAGYTSEPTWERTEVTQERVSQEDIATALKKLSDPRCSVHEKKISLNNSLQGQLSALLDNLQSAEQDRSFEWSLAQLDETFKTSWFGKKELITLTVYVKRSPLKDLNPVMLYQTIEKMKAEFFRPPQLQRQSRPLPPPPPPPPTYFDIERGQKLRSRHIGTDSDPDSDSSRSSIDSGSFKSFDSLNSK
jgi:hypothetical protein